MFRRDCGQSYLYLTWLPQLLDAAVVGMSQTAGTEGIEWATTQCSSRHFMASDGRWCWRRKWSRLVSCFWTCGVSIVDVACSNRCKHWNSRHTGCRINCIVYHVRNTRPTPIVLNVLTWAVGHRAVADCLLGYVCLSVCVIISCQQSISTTNLWICAKFIADMSYTVPWKRLTFDANLIQVGWVVST